MPHAQFLIQSDFITQASREDVFHSTRNESLLSGVAETFRDAVLQFCHHPRLQYQWMRYLPSDSISDEFWKNLRPQIISLLSNTRCLRPWSETSLLLPSQLHRLRTDYKDRHGKPLFEDSIEESYLSQYYTSTDFQSLRSLGTRMTYYNLLIARIQSDLGRANSKMKAITTDEDWHRRAAEALSEPFASTINRYTLAIKVLDLIPLQDSRWVSARTIPIFLPNTGKTPIPSDLGLNLVQPVATLNDARKTLFLHLGVTNALPRNIISLISQRYVGLSLPPTIDENIAHLRYLYWNLPEDVLGLDRDIFLMDQNKRRVYRITHFMKYMYFEEEVEEYGPQQLLQSGPLDNPDAPGLAVHFLNAVYLDAVPTGALHHKRSWKQWLTEFAGVRSYPQLRNPIDHRLSDEFKYIIEHRPEKLVGLLNCYWSSYEFDMIPAVVIELRNCWVPSDADLAVNLASTFLPLPRLKAMVERLKIADFPFLIMPEELTDENENEWQFLKQFGVRSSGGSDDLHFYLEALNRIADENEDACSPDILEALFEVYGAIERNCSSSDDAAYIWQVLILFSLSPSNFISVNISRVRR